MISLILPYWMRQEAADKALLRLERLYAGADLEVIVVDDGSEVAFVSPCKTLPVRVITLPVKTVPTSPLRPWNVGAAAARGEVIVLSCVEILHEEPIMEQMAEHVRKLGPKGYVLAAAWCPEDGRWHCHSTVKPPYNAAGTGIGFCAALHKSLFEEAGGFDEDYLAGAGYEDCDWINRLLRAGALFVHRDDLVVTHPKTGASINWGSERFARNFDLFRRKWPESPANNFLNFVCVKAGTAYGPEYVNILYDMVRRNLIEGYPGRFVCITDDPSGLDAGIQTMALPDGLEKWYGKLYMFKRGLFADGSRCLFMDLDTVIVGNLNGLAAYAGQFATLKDFMAPSRLGPAVIAWEAGEFAASIWEEWEAQGRPRNSMGDLWWLNNLDQGRFARRIDKLQDIFPGDFASFKVDCRPMYPKGTKVVCFHGEPRPHNCGVEWVEACWKVGGGTADELELSCNVSRSQIVQNIRANLKRRLPELASISQHDGDAVLVGGGPSLNDKLDELRGRQARGQTVFALNGAGHHLIAQGITPDFVVILDARPDNAAFVVPGIPVYVASHCDAAVFQRAPEATLFHVNNDGIHEGLDGRPAEVISTGSTVGLVAIGIAHILGFRRFHLYGYDSSYTDGHHAYRQPLNDRDSVIEATAAGRTFKCAPWMVLQVQQFQNLARQLADEGCVITVAGDGLLPHVARAMAEMPLAA